jgi:hypothetical protein
MIKLTLYIDWQSKNDQPLFIRPEHIISVTQGVRGVGVKGDKEFFTNISDTAGGHWSVVEAVEWVVKMITA